MAKGKYQKWLEPDGLILLEGWARDGLTNEQISKNMGISRETLNEWKKTYSDISDALKKGRQVTDYMVESALLQSALDGNVAAQIFWLKNRAAKKWKDKPLDETDEDTLKKLKELLGGIPSAF